MHKKYWIAISLCFSTIILYLLFLRGAGNLRFAPEAHLTTQSSIPCDPSLTRTARPPALDVLRDPYVPPVKQLQTDIRAEYSQVGILTRDDLILPLFGRQYSRRDKWQYYAISNTGNLNTKLPIRVNGRSATSEYGCDQIFNNDRVFVEGYKETMSATIYENNQFSYTPEIFNIERL